MEVMEQIQNNAETSNGPHYPHIVFRVKNGYYCVNSKYIESIMQMPTYEPIPDAPPNVCGIFTHRGQAIRLLDMRGTLGVPTMLQEYEEFSFMIDQRKHDHIFWVEELERSVETGEPFTLATDPHKCAFGRWYDNFSTSENVVSFHLRKIEEPHSLLHKAALELSCCEQDCENCQREMCLKNVMEKAKEDYMPKILGLLEETKDIFRETIYREMVLIIAGEAQLGIIVDEVLSVEDLVQDGDASALDQFHSSPIIADIQKSEKIKNMILQIDVPQLLESIGLDSVIL